MTEAKSAPQGAGITRSRPAASASRSVQERSEREAGARRALFVASVAGLAAALSVVAVSGGPPHVAEEVQTASGGETPAARRIVAEFPIPAADGQGIETIVRIVAAGPDTVAPDIRTGATP